MSPGMAPTEKDAQRRLYLRASIKVLLAIGFIFLLVPFIGSLPWLQDEPADPAAFLPESSVDPGATRRFELADGTAIFVTRSSPARAQGLRDTPAERLWFPSAPGLAGQPWFVVAERNAVDETVRFLPARAAWPGGFVAESGGAWDVAGRALKPGPGHPTGHAMKVQNLLPLPFRVRDGGIELPAPLAGAAAAQ
ncbi:MAG: hypothetical protein K0R03_774 [Moraxellaceae bacterium]|nr:hypothetical protein [Moraxellaceae bacterium]